MTDHERRMLSVWFFIGVLLSAYGIIILVTAIAEFSRPSTAVLSQYHPGLFGGILLILIGGFYAVWFRPRK